ncbi:MAG: hypothetical protein EBU36_01455, partial [Verrucomicrobia bacterium]|nr:hypothetical protein [Verrucomicrobiota bacterium]
MSEKNNSAVRLSAGVSGAVLLLAGILGWKGMLASNVIVSLVFLAVGGFVVVALKDRWKRIRWGEGEIELKGKKSPLENPQGHTNPIRRMYSWTLRWAGTPYALPALIVISFLESSIFPIPPDV